MIFQVPHNPSWGTKLTMVINHVSIRPGIDPPSTLTYPWSSRWLPGLFGDAWHLRVEVKQSRTGSSWNLAVSFWRGTFQGTSISPTNPLLEMIFMFPEVGYVSSLEGNVIRDPKEFGWLRKVFWWFWGFPSVTGWWFEKLLPKKTWGRFVANPLIQVLTCPSIFLSGVVQSPRKQAVSSDSLEVVKELKPPVFCKNRIHSGAVVL